MARRNLDGELIGLTLLAVTNAAQVYSLYVPDFATLRTGASRDDKPAQQAADLTAALRVGYVPATGLSLAVGAAASLLSRSWLPLAATGAASLALLAIQEQALPTEQRLHPLAALLAGVRPLLGERPAPALPPPAGTVIDAEVRPAGSQHYGF